MRVWQNRSAEEANLLNPTFIGLVCHRAIKEYCKTARSGAPYPLPFLITPLVLYKKTRLSLPSRVSTPFVTWILCPEGTQAKTKYAAHAISLVPSVKESLSFAIKHELLSITPRGEFVPATTVVQDYDKKSSDFTEEVMDCFKRAAFCGRWIARAGRIETVMALLGVKP